MSRQPQNASRFGAARTGCAGRGIGRLIRIGGAVIAFVLFVAACLSVVLIEPQGTAVAQEQPAPEILPRQETVHWEGVASCSASACHGSTRRQSNAGIWGNEYSLWATRDPHHRAYRVLFEERSQRILANLFQEAHFDKLTIEQQQTCLACHSTASAAAPEYHDVLLADGVSCESCHGPAGEWLGPHTVGTWNERRPEFVERGSLCNTKNLVVRAERCVSCHVGGADRDVNHDLIAAGHPRMFFELGAYLDRLPKHWTEEDTRPDFEARAWAIGQTATAQQALQLLAARAERAADQEDSPPSVTQPLLWPELSEYGCYACHHDLGSRQAGLDRPGESLRPGELPWGTWYFRLLRRMTDPQQASSFPLDGAAWHESIDAIDLAMRRLVPSAATWQTLDQQIPRARSALEACTAELDARRISSPEATLWMFDLATAGCDAADWDESAQILLGLAALRPAQADQTVPPELDELLAELRNLLSFSHHDSPQDFELSEVHATFQRLRALLARSVEEHHDA